jgi:hypothetical protein
MPATSYTYNGRTYTAEQLGEFKWQFTGYGCTIIATTDVDLNDEFGNDADAWGQHIDEELLSLGLIDFYTDVEAYMTPDDYEEMMTQNRWQVEHIKLYSGKSDFI